MAQESKVNVRIQGKPARKVYRHADWETRRRFLRFLIRWIGFGLLAKIDQVEGIENVPDEGPGILMINHIAFVDPIAVLNVLPRNIVPMAKVEVYNYPIIGIFPRLWGVVPVRREEFDRRAIQGALDILKAGEIILMAPEATRSQALQKGKEGVAFIASRAGVPVIPVAIDGSPGFPALRFTKRWSQPGIHIQFGRPFRFRKSYSPADKSSEEERSSAGRPSLTQMTEEAMYILARLLPEYRRGFYSDLSKATEETIEYV